MIATLKTKKRQASTKTWIRDLLTGNFVKGVGWNPSYIEFGGKNISRAHLVATVVAKFLSEDGNYGALTLDDGTETIRSKAFGPDVMKLKNCRVGAIVRFIGKVKEYNDEIYLSPDVVRELDDPNWLLVHKLALGTPESGIPSPEDVKPEVPESVALEVIKEEDTSVQKKILDSIRNLDAGQGADMPQVILNSKLEEEEAKNIIVGLLKSGEVYEPRKGKLRALD